MKQTVLQKLYAEGGMEAREDGPEHTDEKVHYEMADRTRPISAGGIGVIHRW